MDNTLLTEFLDYSHLHRLMSGESRILLAVSGGIDSMVMASLFREAGITHSIAHCNFSLRGEESDGDEQFVGDYAKTSGIRCFRKTFDTLSFASLHGLSVQMAARQLRYRWFDELIEQENFDAVAVAHNLNDNVETFLINLLRGTGINGLTGIDPRNGNIIRPLLFATREQISGYASAKRISYREDSSNLQTKYTRNRIRHNVLPEMDAVSGNALSSIMNTISHLGETAVVLDVCLREVRRSIFRDTEEGTDVSLRALSSLDHHESFLFELFREYGVSGRQTGELRMLLKAPVGRYLRTTTHRIVRDRGRLLIIPSVTEGRREHSFSSIDDMRISGLFSDICISPPLDEGLPSDRRTACLDLAQLKFPLSYRPWQPGDRFSPLGMKKEKKISDFLTDIKLPLPVKEKVMVLVSGNQVAWVAGYRIDDRYRVTDKTEQILIITL